MAERKNLTREEYNAVFGTDVTEEEYEKIMAAKVSDYEELTQLTLVDKKTMKEYRFTKVNTLMLNIDGKDRIHVEVKKGITIDGIVTAAQKFGNQFQINGYLTEEEL
jgi:hypothetical protein